MTKCTSDAKSRGASRVQSISHIDPFSGGYPALTMSFPQVTAQKKCPYCDSELMGKVCPRCGVICSRCGTPYRTAYCPECYSESPSAPDNTPHGEVAPSPQEFRRIFGRYVSKKEQYMMRGTFLSSRMKEVHDKALAAVKFIQVSSETQNRLQERVEQRSSSLIKGGASLEKAVSYALLVETKQLGMSLTTVQEALARAGFRMRFDSYLVKVVTTRTSMVVEVNDYERSVNATPANDREDDRLRLLMHDKAQRSFLYAIRVPLYLQDALSDGDVVKITFDDSKIVSFEERYSATQVDESTLELRLDPRKCFELFKVRKELFEQSDSSPVVFNADYYARRFSPSKFPVSRMLMKEAQCLTAVEQRFYELFRERVERAGGRSPQKIVIEALYDADSETFALLSFPVKSRMKLVIAGYGLSQRDIRYTCVSGLLIPSEVGVPVSKEAGEYANDG